MSTNETCSVHLVKINNSYDNEMPQMEIVDINSDHFFRMRVKIKNIQ